MIDLSSFDNRWYSPGHSTFTRALWFFLGAPVLRTPLLPFSAPRRWLLRCFGAKVGRGVVIKPGARVKYPWRLVTGNHSWIGEDSWIDNIADVTIGSSACISQGAYLCTGNHDWSDPAFGLQARPISIGEGAWVGARALITPGVSLGECAIAAAGSVVTRDIPPYEIHAGNPARFVRKRELRSNTAPNTQPLTGVKN